MYCRKNWCRSALVEIAHRALVLGSYRMVLFKCNPIAMGGVKLRKVWGSFLHFYPNSLVSAVWTILTEDQVLDLVCCRSPILMQVTSSITSLARTQSLERGA